MHIQASLLGLWDVFQHLRRRNRRAGEEGEEGEDDEANNDSDEVAEFNRLVFGRERMGDDDEEEEEEDEEEDEEHREEEEESTGESEVNTEEYSHMKLGEVDTLKAAVSIYIYIYLSR